MTKYDHTDPGLHTRTQTDLEKLDLIRSTDESMEPDPTVAQQNATRQFAFEAECGKILRGRQAEYLAPVGYANPASSSSSSSLQEVALDTRSAILSAALKYRAIARNRPGEVSLEAHMATDDRVVAARLRLERELLQAGLLAMDELDFAVNLIPVGLQITTPSKNLLITL